MGNRGLSFYKATHRRRGSYPFKTIRTMIAPVSQLAGHRTTDLQEIKNEILKTLAYFDLFGYPITREEIYKFLHVRCDFTPFRLAVISLVNERAMYRFGTFYTLKNDQVIVGRRNLGNRRAAELMKRAVTAGKLLSWFPFVRGVAVSGSLSKNFVEENDDVNLFIITVKNRLWIARACLTVLLKLSDLIDRRRYFCLNHFIDESAMEVPERNIYIATEISTLIPLQGDVTLAEFFSSNTWTRDFLPNNIMYPLRADKNHSGFPAFLVEFLLNNRLGDWLDTRLFRLFARHFAAKQANEEKNGEGLIPVVDISKHFLKSNAGNFHENLVAGYEQQVSELMAKQRESAFC
jgi:hypothetical protein